MVRPIVATALESQPGDELPEEFQAQEAGPRTRRPLAEIVFHGTWDTIGRIE